VDRSRDWVRRPPPPIDIVRLLITFFQIRTYAPLTGEAPIDQGFSARRRANGKIVQTGKENGAKTP